MNRKSSAYQLGTLIICGIVCHGEDMGVRLYAKTALMIHKHYHSSTQQNDDIGRRTIMRQTVEVTKIQKKVGFKINKLKYHEQVVEKSCPESGFLLMYFRLQDSLIHFEIQDYFHIISSHFNHTQ